MVARDLNALRVDGPMYWVDASAWLMVFLCCFAQCCVWSSFIFETDILMWYEELNWAVMFILNTAINVFFVFSDDMKNSNDPRYTCVYLSLIFGAIFLPFQILGHLPYIDNIDRQEKRKKEKVNLTFAQVKKGCWRSLVYRKQSVTAKAWGGDVGAFWMFGYWVLEPFWLLWVAYTYSQKLNGV